MKQVHPTYSVSDVLKFRAESGLGAYAAERALTYGAHVLRAQINRERAIAAAAKLGLSLPTPDPETVEEGANQQKSG